MYFMADSVIAILVNKEEIKVLYTEKFNPGSVTQMTENMLSRDFKSTVEGTKASELEVGHIVSSIRPGLVTY